MKAELITLKYNKRNIIKDVVRFNQEVNEALSIIQNLTISCQMHQPEPRYGINYFSAFIVWNDIGVGSHDIQRQLDKLYERLRNRKGS